MDYQPSVDHTHHREQSQQPPEPYRPHGQSPGNSEEQKREFLWRELLSRQMHRQALVARAASLTEEWDALQQHKASMQRQKPKLAMLIVLSRLFGIRLLPAERQFWYERERLAQDKARLRQARACCQHDLDALQAQIEVIQHELWSRALAAYPSPF